jgi:hypothetical protein
VFVLLFVALVHPNNKTFYRPMYKQHKRARLKEEGYGKGTRKGYRQHTWKAHTNVFKDIQYEKRSLVHPWV